MQLADPAAARPAQRLADGYDLIGDIHGESEKLEGLLAKLGYVPHGLAYRPPTGRQAIFLGDLIDRGPGQARVIEVVRGMVEAGDAHCIMGNHEFNAVSYTERDVWRTDGECFRPNRLGGYTARKNREQHEAFMAQVGSQPTLYRSTIDWFRTLPVFLDLADSEGLGLRAVHGTWHSESVEVLRRAGWGQGEALTADVLNRVHSRLGMGDPELAAARQRLTCGLELPLPDGRVVVAGTHQFENVRIADWRHWAEQLQDAAMLPEGQEHVVDGIEIDLDAHLTEVEGRPVFIGHHWFRGVPKCESPKLACLDYSAAKGGPLVAYRWDGEQSLSDDKFVGFGA